MIVAFVIFLRNSLQGDFCTCKIAQVSPENLVKSCTNSSHHRHISEGSANALGEKLKNHKDIVRLFVKTAENLLFKVGD